MAETGTGKNRRRSMCAYCGRVGVAVEDEHVFPESWYPDGFPRTAMLLVPSCRACNGTYGRIEERLFLPLVADLPYEDAAIRTVIERALRGVDPDAGRDVRDVTHRAARRRSIERRFELVRPNDPLERVVWTGGPREARETRTPAGLIVRGIPAVRIDPDDLTRLGIKFLKGCYYAASGLPLRTDAICDAYAFSENPREVFAATMRRIQPNRGGQWPFEVAFTRATEDDAVTIWWFVLWGRIGIFASSTSPERASEMNDASADHLP